MVGIFFWVAVGALVAAVLLLIWVGVGQESWFFGLNLGAVAISAFMALILGMTWIADQGTAYAETQVPKNQCLVQEYQSVWEGKVEGHKWVCIGWATP